MNGVIRFDENWVIIVEDMNYIVSKDAHRTRISDKKDDGPQEIPVYESKAYYRDLEGALEYLRREVIRENLQDAEMSLHEAIRTVQDITDRFIKTINEALKGR